MGILSGETKSFDWISKVFKLTCQKLPRKEFFSKLIFANEGLTDYVSSLQSLRGSADHNSQGGWKLLYQKLSAIYKVCQTSFFNICATIGR